MKKIFIMRHGQAQPVNFNDRARQLTQDGTDQVIKMTAWLQHQLPDGLDVVLASPFIRTQETAQVVKRAFSDVQLDLTIDDLIPEADPGRCVDYIQALIASYPEYHSWLLVSHMPIVSYLVDQFCPTQMPAFNTAAIAEIHFDEQTDKAEFNKMISPAKLENCE